MKPRVKFAALAATCVIAAAPFVQPAFADAAKPATKDAVSAATATAIEKDAQILRTANDVYRALREVRAARFAIFNGTAEVAGTMASDAMKDLEAAQLNAKDFAVDVKKAKSSGDMYVPFDMSMALAEGFVATPEKAEKVKEANAHISKGDHKKAAEVLKLANIDVTVTAALLPINASVRHAKDAVKLVGEKKYYEANLALKAIEDSVILDAYGIDVVPAQGGKG